MKSIHDIRKELDQRTRDSDVRKQVVDRASRANAVLTDETSRWLAGLPMKVRPLSLARKYPRIANGVADLWREVANCKEYLDSLVVDLRGDRSGFPPDVATELLALRSHYSELHPDKGSSWDLVAMDD
jgi:hypothetical protein